MEEDGLVAEQVINKEDFLLFLIVAVRLPVVAKTEVKLRPWIWKEKPKHLEVRWKLQQVPVTIASCAAVDMTSAHSPENQQAVVATVIC